MEIREIKARLLILEVLRRYRLKPDASGRLRCPFHDDTTPSLQIYSETNTFCCFSTNCNAGSGDVIDFIEKIEHCSTHQAILKAKAMIQNGPASPTNGRADTANGQADDDVAEAACWAVLEVAFFRFQESLAKSRRAKAYLKQRGLNLKRLKALGLRPGYNNGTFHQNEDRLFLDFCCRAGLLSYDARRETYKVFARSCLMLPLRDRDGRIASLYGRSLSEGKARHFYLKRRRGLYPAYPPETTRQLILTEAILDAASFLMIDLPAETAVLALYGTEGWTQEHTEAVEALAHLDEIVLCFDGDAAGHTATEKLAGALRTLRPEVLISTAKMPEGEDANSVLTGDGPERLRALLDERVTLASPEPAAAEPPTDRAAHLETANPEALRFQADSLTITVLGGIRMTGLDRLRVTLKVERPSGPSALAFHDGLDLYQARRVEDLAHRLAEHFELERRAVRQVLAALTEALERYRLSRIEAMTPPTAKAPTLSRDDYAEAHAYLSAPLLMQRTGHDIGHSGVVGEETNRLLMYLVFTSRKMAHPLHVISLGKSGLGKTHLQETVGRLIPEEDKLEVTAFSDNALYYFAHDELRHKLILIEDLDGAGTALYPLRELQSKGRLSKTLAIKDAKGQLKAVTVKVEGPVSVAGCTTREALYEDNATRCFLLHLDASPEQDEAILCYQRQLAAGVISRGEQAQVQRLLQNMQRLLKPVSVRNPFAEQLALPKQVFTRRRSNQLYLSFVEAVTFYHQYQRQVKTDEETGEVYIETTVEDIAWANRLLASVLVTKSDELTGACRRFFERLKMHLAEAGREHFRAGEVRKALRLSPTSLNRYLLTLRRYGLVRIEGGNRARGYLYQIADSDEYTHLRHEVQAVLDGVLARLKDRGGSSPVAQQ